MKIARESAGLTQKQVALTLHVSCPTVSNWESGKINPNVENLKALCELYQVSSDYLLGLKEQKAFSGNEPPLTEDEQLLIQIYRQINQEGQEKTLDYADDLSRSGKYIKHHETPLVYQETG